MVYSIMAFQSSWNWSFLEVILMNQDQKDSFWIMLLIMAPVIPLLVIMLIIEIGYLIWPCPC